MALRICTLGLALSLALSGCKTITEELEDEEEQETPAVESDAAAEPAEDRKVDGAVPVRLDGSPPPGSFVEPKWIDVAAGSFSMGSPSSESCRRDDEDQHQVTISRAFQLAETEVTEEQFHSLMGYNPSFPTCGPQCPVSWVSWHEAVAYCNALSSAKGLPACYSCSGKGSSVACAPVAGKDLLDCGGYRLPTEAEFEYTTRAGTTTALPGGNIVSCMSSDSASDKIAWYKANSTGLARPVKGKAANAWGFFDLTGNVYEWVEDFYTAHLGTAPAKDPQGPAAAGYRVFRGGAYYFNAEHLRSAHRLAYLPAKRFTYLGFRCARRRP